MDWAIQTQALTKNFPATTGWRQLIRQSGNLLPAVNQVDLTVDFRRALIDWEANQQHAAIHVPAGSATINFYLAYDWLRQRYAQNRVAEQQEGLHHIQ